jgi:N-acetylglucosaminyl-diphospho-decaprenol L-rhamnosyltransferase
MGAGVSAIVVNYNSGLDLINCLASLAHQDPPLNEVIVVDNNSRDQSLIAALAAYPNIRPLRNAANEGFASAVNQGGAAAKGDVLVFLNPDVVLSNDCVRHLASTLADAPGVAGPVLVVDADVHEERGRTIDRLGHSLPLTAAAKPLYVEGCVLATSRSFFERLGGFDERYFIFAEDVDYCWRVLLAGGEVQISTGARAQHRGGAVVPGGYIRSGRIETTAFRFLLRERNTLATLLKCAPAPWLLWLIPAYVTRTLVVAAALLYLRRPGVARDVLGGLFWNARWLRQTYRLRRKVPRTKASQRIASQRLHQGLIELDLVRRFGLPRFID